jgi:hypothetical protein
MISPRDIYIIGRKARLLSGENPADLIFIKDLIEKGELRSKAFCPNAGVMTIPREKK